MDMWQHLKRSMKIEWWTSHDDQTSRDDAASSKPLKHLGAPSLIEQT